MYNSCSKAMLERDPKKDEVSNDDLRMTIERALQTKYVARNDFRSFKSFLSEKLKNKFYQSRKIQLVMSDGTKSI